MGSHAAAATVSKSFDTTGSTDFVITTVNVPDRLDVQEVRARADEDDDRTDRFRIDWYLLRLWLTRLIALGLVGVAGYFGWRSIEPLREELSAHRIASRLSAALEDKVTVGSTGFKWLPTPRFVLGDVDFGNAWRVQEVALHFNWEDARRALQGGGWIWGEAAISPTRVDAVQAEQMLTWMSRLDRALPGSISTIRLETFELSGMRLLPGRFEAVVRRNEGGRLGPVVLRSLGETKLLLTLSTADADNAFPFKLEASQWALPAGPRGPWSDVHAVGRISRSLVAVDEYLLIGFFGSVKGSLFAAGDAEWVLTGTATAANIDIESVLKQLRGPVTTGDGTREPAVPMSGTASLNLSLSGKGKTFDDAVNQAIGTGTARVRWATLNGINLGYAATRPGSPVASAGGVTRFTEMAADAVLRGSGTSFQAVTARAGAMATRGEITVAPDLRLTGALRVDLGATRVQAPLNLRVRGTALAPEFGR